MKQEISYVTWGLIGHRIVFPSTMTERQKIPECIEDISILWSHFDEISVWKHCVSSGGEESRETQEGIDAIFLA